MAELSLPDFDDILALADRIEVLMKEKMLLDVDIKLGETRTAKEVNTNPAFFTKKGEPPAAAFIEQNYRYAGLKEELIPLRRRYAEVAAELEKTNKKFEAYRMMVEAWRTISANERKSLS